MKKNVYILIITLIIFSCKAQKKEIEAESKDVFLFNNENQNFSLLNNKYNETVYKDNDYLIFTQNWTGYGSHYFDKEYSFIQAKDTMNIKCKCGQEQNHFFKNLKFQKGKFELSYNFPQIYDEQTKKYQSRIDYIFGNKIKTTKKIQSILFKNSYVWWETKGKFKDIYFKDLKFIKIDLNDSTNVKLKKLD
jgi:hypothetical protein